MRYIISEKLLPAIFNMSLTASVVIIFVLLVRFILKRAPKVFSYVLWAVVLFRLLCPIAVTAEFSLLRLFQPPTEKTTPIISSIAYVKSEREETQKVVPQTPEIPAPIEAPSENQEIVLGHQKKVPVSPIEVLWLGGVVTMLGYSMVSLFCLRKKLIGAVPLQKNIYLADHIASPFVLGILRPKIYLPSALSERELGYIILHEQYHIRRGDPIMKVLSFAALSLHWFNPLVWVAFILSGKDMEMSCDEAVVKRLGEEVRSDYSASLLSLATGRRIIAGTPLAFGEGDPKRRIQNIMRWKKPKKNILLGAAVLCGVTVIACACNPQYASTGKEQHKNKENQIVQQETNPGATSVPEKDESSQMLEQGVNRILVGGLTYDENAEYPSTCTLTASEQTGRTDTYTIALRTYASIENTPGRQLIDDFDWTVDPAGSAPGENRFTFQFENDQGTITVYSDENRLELEEDGRHTVWLGSPRFSGLDAGASRVFITLRRLAVDAAYQSGVYSNCSVSGKETDYTIIAQELAEQFAQSILERPGWFPQLAQDVRVSKTEILDAYYGEENPNFCFALELALKLDEEQRNNWEVGSGLREPSETGPDADYFGWGIIVSVGKNTEGEWHITGTGSGFAGVELPVSLESATTQQLMQLYFLTDGLTHDEQILGRLSEKPLEEVRTQIQELPESQRQEMKDEILDYIEEYPNTTTWSASDFA